MLNLFALTNDPASPIRRFPLASDVQLELTKRLKAQATAFLSNVHSGVLFDGKYKPEDDELLYAEDVPGTDALANAITDPMSCGEMDATPSAFESIKGLFSGWPDTDGKLMLVFQNFDRRRVISTKGFSIYHAANVYKQIEGVGLSLDTKLAAVHVNNTLWFRSFHNVRILFDLTAHYVEATDIDIAQFAALDSISATDIDVLVAMSDGWTRRKIALIQQSQILTKVPMAEIKAAAIELGIALICSTKGGYETIVLPTTKRELKTLLHFLDEDYYKSSLSKTNFLTNSKRLA